MHLDRVGDQPNHPDSLENEFRMENERREALMAQISEAANLDELIGLLNTHEEIPGLRKTFKTRDMIGVLEALKANPQLFDQSGKNMEELDDLRANLAKFLKVFTRALGLRRKVAELIGMEGFYPERFLEKE